MSGEMASPEDENEAMRRCLDAGYTLKMEARNLTSFPANDHRPLWRAHYLPKVIAERQLKAEAKALASMLLVSSPALGAALFNLAFGGWGR